MALTPSDIEQKTFSTALRGYDLNEVDDFLDEVVATIRQLEEQLTAARAGGAAPVETATPPPVPSPAPAVDESAVGRALVAAQEAADRLLGEARSEADRIRDDARAESETWVAERESKKAEADREMADLEQRVASVRRELAVLATAVADRLDEMDAAIRGEATVDSTYVMVDEEDDESVDLEDLGGLSEGEDVSGGYPDDEDEDDEDEEDEGEDRSI